MATDVGLSGRWVIGLVSAAFMAVALVVGVVAVLHGRRQPRSASQVAVSKPAPSLRPVKSSAQVMQRATIQALAPGRIAPPAYDKVSTSAAKPAPPPRSEDLKLRHATGIETLLRLAGVEKSQLSNWGRVFRSAAHSAILRPGHHVVLLKDRQNGSLQGLRYDVDDRLRVIEQSLGDGVVFATRQPLTYYPKTVSCSLALRSGLRKSAASQHVPKFILDRIKSIFGTHLKSSGAILKLVYRELVTPDGDYHRDAALEAAEVKTSEKHYDAFAFRDSHGRAHLYDAEGHQLGTRFLRFPLHFRYISSTFSMSRYHPILHIYRPHYGVDLAARYGTPVKAAGDGVVQFAGWDGELGWCIKIRHPNGLISLYGHLSKIEPDARKGDKVTLGEIIGRVGDSGLATGPHLHYGLYKDGHFINPLTAKLNLAVSIPKDRMALFDRFKSRWQELLSRLPNKPTAPHLAPGAASLALSEQIANASIRAQGHSLETEEHLRKVALRRHHLRRRSDRHHSHLHRAIAHSAGDVIAPSM